MSDGRQSLTEEMPRPTGRQAGPAVDQLKLPAPISLCVGGSVMDDVFCSSVEHRFDPRGMTL